MRRLPVLALVLLTLSAPNAPANGFGQVRRPAEVRYPSYYYYPTTVYTPVLYPVLPAYVLPTPIVTPTIPVAIPRAPPSLSGEPPLASSRPAVGTESAPAEARTALRPGDSFYTLLPGPAGMARADDRCSVAFWNLTGRTLTLRADGKEYSVQVGRSVTVDVPASFAWQVIGREAEATRVPTGHASAEILIRR